MIELNNEKERVYELLLKSGLVKKIGNADLCADIAESLLPLVKENIEHKERIEELSKKIQKYEKKESDIKRIIDGEFPIWDEWG